MALDILQPVCFHINFRINLPISTTKNLCDSSRLHWLYRSINVAHLSILLCLAFFLVLLCRAQSRDLTYFLKYLSSVVIVSCFSMSTQFYSWIVCHQYTGKKNLCLVNWSYMFWIYETHLWVPLDFSWIPWDFLPAWSYWPWMEIISIFPFLCVHAARLLLFNAPP